MRKRSLARVTLGFLVLGQAFAQQGGVGGATTGGTSTPAPTTPSTGSPNTGHTPTPAPTPQPAKPQPMPPAPVFVSGVVRLPDGSEPPERVTIERICSTNNVRVEGYTDSKGRFGIQLGLSQQLIPDASSTMFIEATQGFPNGTRSNGMANAAANDPNFDCELRARLPGHISTTVLLAGRRPMDNPDVGTIILTPMAKIEGKAISGTSAWASKEARKALEKGVGAAKKQKYDQAETELRKAVEIHPKYAEAWLQLGKVYLSRKQSAEARDAFKHSIAADPAFVYPYEQLYRIAFEQAQWQELADTTERLLRLNPYEFPDAFYFNGVALYQLRDWDAAEKSLIQAIRVDQRNINPKTRYVLGLVLVQKKQYAKAMENFTTFTAMAPTDSQVPKARSLMNEIAKLEQ